MNNLFINSVLFVNLLFRGLLFEGFDVVVFCFFVQPQLFLIVMRDWWSGSNILILL